jgi:poly-gamma-glutamate synthesis protein (capsule biosynthesis protein)
MYGWSTKRWFGVLGLPALLAAGLLSWIIMSHPATPIAKLQPVSSSTPEQAPATTAALTSKLLVMGDVFWGRYVNDWSLASPLGHAYPFAGLKTFDRPAYDAWIANMECPITTNPLASSAVQEATLTFNCSPDYLPEAAKWFTAMSLANNHTDNQGAAGYRQTVQLLNQAGIQTFGHYDPEAPADRCNIISLPAHLKLTDQTTKDVKVPTAWCGYNGVFKTPTKAAIQDLGRYADKFITFAMPHSGTEYREAPDQIKTDFFHGLVDAGADAVIGGHPHWVQTSEAYKGKLLVYSVGNFMFDQQSNREVTRGVAVEVNMEVDAAAAPELDKWVKLANTCGAADDDCLQQATDQNLTKLPVKLSYDVRSSDDSGRQTHAGDAALTTSVKERLQWSKTTAGLGK